MKHRKNSKTPTRTTIENLFFHCYLLEHKSHRLLSTPPPHPQIHHVRCIASEKNMSSDGMAIPNWKFCIGYMTMSVCVGNASSNTTLHRTPLRQHFTTFPKKKVRNRHRSTSQIQNMRECVLLRSVCSDTIWATKSSNVRFFHFRANMNIFRKPEMQFSRKNSELILMFAIIQPNEPICELQWWRFKHRYAFTGSLFHDIFKL